MSIPSATQFRKRLLSIKNSTRLKDNTKAWKYHEIEEQLEDALCVIDSTKYMTKYVELKTVLRDLNVLQSHLPKQAQESVYPAGIRSR